MNPNSYFKKNGEIYGMSIKFSFGKWSGYTRRFTDWDKAQTWLNTEEYDFRDRLLVSKTTAKRWGYKED